MIGHDIKPAARLCLDARELWRFRELFVFMAWRDIKVKYKQTLLGFAWVVLQPLVLMLIFSAVWLKVMKTDIVQGPYALFAYCGLIYWGLFSSGVTNAAESMLSNANIIKKVYFPRIIIPASAVMVALFDFAMTLTIYLLLIAYYRPPINIVHCMFLLPLSVLTTFAASFGLGLIIAAATLKYRDFRYVVPFFLQALFFVSPVVIPLSVYGAGPLHFFLSLNPLAGAIHLARAALTGAAVHWTAATGGMAFAAVLLVAGLAYFQKTESRYADVL